MGKGERASRGAGRRQKREKRNVNRMMHCVLTPSKGNMGDTRVGARAAALLREVVNCEPENLPPYNV